MASGLYPFLHLFETLEDARTWRAALPAELAAVVTLIPLTEAWERARGRVAAMSRP